MKRVIMVLVIGWVGGSGGVGWAEAPAAPAAPETSSATAPASTAPAEVVVIEDELPTGAKAVGTWEWEAGQAASGTTSHAHPTAPGMQQHGLTLAAPLVIPRNGEIVTSVWLDPANPPRGLMVKFSLENGQESGVYWEGEEEVFNPGENEEIWYYGLLPEYGVWTPLSVVAEDLGIEETRLMGITFVTYDGRALWDRTVVRQAAAPPELPPLEEDELEVLETTPPATP